MGSLAINKEVASLFALFTTNKHIGRESLVYKSYTRDSRLDGSASKPVLIQDASYMVEKTYHIALYLGASGA